MITSYIAGQIWKLVRREFAQMKLVQSFVNDASNIWYDQDAWRRLRCPNNRTVFAQFEKVSWKTWRLQTAILDPLSRNPWLLLDFSLPNEIFWTVVSQNKITTVDRSRLWESEGEPCRQSLEGHGFNYDEGRRKRFPETWTLRAIEITTFTYFRGRQ